MGKIEERPGKVSFKQAWKDFFIGYVDFKGRSTRAGYWWIALIKGIFFIIALIMMLVFFFSFGFSNLESGEEELSPAAVRQLLMILIFIIILFIISLGLILPNIALYVRRLRDVGLRGRGQLVIMGILMVGGLIVTLLQINASFQLISTQLNTIESNTALSLDDLYPTPYLVNSRLYMLMFLLRMVPSIGSLILTVLPTGTLATTKETGILAFFFKNKKFYEDIEL